MSISGQLGAFLAVAMGYVLVAFVWGWHKRREESENSTTTTADGPDEPQGGDH